ncbi:hypothetical protein ACFYR1_04525 [Streptomyces canus]|uniref:hypothetical protein n=1 Tax=Streptomyces canus TaxID=58343 RepID=UPI003685BDEA
MARARATGKPVQATAATTDSSTLTANPNGALTLRQTVAPVRRLVHGRWKSLDPTLVRHANGTISPKVTTGTLSLSGGGKAAPLASMGAGSGSLAVSLPAQFALRTPTLSGATATYHDVLADVDLAVTVQDTGGFSEVLVVKNAAAAANPALADLNLSTKVTGVTLASDKAGDISAKVPVGNDGKIDLYTHVDSTGGTTALIVDLTGYFTSNATVTGDQTYTPLSSAVRALDTRSSIAHTNLTSTGTVAVSTNFTLQITGLNNIPATATAVAVNLAAANATGYLQAYATGYTPTADTSLSFTNGNTIASLSGDVPIGTSGTITISVHGNATAVLADISGYYTTTTTGQKFHTLNPTRLVDTRSGIGGTSSAVAANTAYTLTTATTQQVIMATTPTRHAHPHQHRLGRLRHRLSHRCRQAGHQQHQLGRRRYSRQPHPHPDRHQRTDQHLQQQLRKYRLRRRLQRLLHLTQHRHQRAEGPACKPAAGPSAHTATSASASAANAYPNQTFPRRRPLDLLGIA